MEQESKIFKIVERVKTPLSITGIALMVMYLVIKKVLDLDIYDNVGAENTFTIIDKIINYVFIVSIVSLLLGITAYLISKFKKKRVNQS
jgi:hypothetical protein